MTDSTKTGPNRATASRRRASAPALSENLPPSGFQFTILPEPPSADPHAVMVWGLGRATSLATRLDGVFSLR